MQFRVLWLFSIALLLNGFSASSDAADLIIKDLIMKDDGTGMWEISAEVYVDYPNASEVRLYESGNLLETIQHSGGESHKMFFPAGNPFDVGMGLGFDVSVALYDGVTLVRNDFIEWMYVPIGKYITHMRARRTGDPEADSFVYHTPYYENDDADDALDIRILAKNKNTSNWDILVTKADWAAEKSSGFVTIGTTVEDDDYLVVADNHYEFKVELVEDGVVKSSDSYIVFK